MNSRHWCLIVSIGFAAHVRAAAPDFERDVAPIIAKRCLECHNDRDAAGKLILTSAERLAAGGESGPAVVAGKNDASYLIERIVSGEMPPPRRGQSQQLPAAEIETLRGWIQGGAAWPAGRKLDLYERTTDVRAGRDWWSLQPIVRPSIPRTSTTDVANPIDAFIAAKLENVQMTAAPAADRRTLLNRIYYDMLGLPPTIDEIEAFADDTSGRAYEMVVDRLLASPHFGERWARYWLDLARFAETSGYERDQPKPHAWRYRDWVVQAINEDLRFDRFVLEQLAGDELPARTESSVIATGFLRLGTWNDEPNDPQEYKYERLEDMVHATSTAFLGMTVKCARCHDHKFDPIPQLDYYKLASAFWAGPIEPRERELLGGPNKDELGFDVLGWTDLGRTPPPLHLLKKGDSKHPGDVVEPGQLTMVSLSTSGSELPADAKTTQRRLKIAHWIIHPSNPLTARVIVNRLWQHHFGQGLVRSPNDFGFNGQRPTHPELLDWLATELIENDWSLKHIHRLILLSKTYQQSSMHPHQAEYAQRDPDNAWWWRMNRHRLDAEAMRDSLLAVSGQMDLRLGGPSFKPTIQPDALEGLSRKSAAWEASPVGEQRRRSLYIFMQRSLLPPLMTTFDAPDTTLPCGQRDITTVAPQALALLNNPFTHEQSEALAERVQREAGDTLSHQIVLAWRLSLRRNPKDQEITDATQYIAEQEAWFAGSGTQAKHYALASLCHVLLNTNEFLYVD